MERKSICDNTTAYDLAGHIEFNNIVASTKQWLFYGISMAISIALIVLYFVYKVPTILMFGIALVVLINAAKFLYEPHSVRRTFGEITAIRGEMTFFYRFYEDGFEQLCRSKKGESVTEISFDCLKKITETPTSFFFMTKDNSGYYMKKQQNNTEDYMRLTEVLKKYSTYKYLRRK